MRYLAILFVDESNGPSNDEERELMTRQYLRFNQDAREAGVYVAGEALQPTETATVVRSLESGPSVSDGPFTESKEVMAGYYLLDCENLDQAIEWASRIPAARKGAVEVRPILELDI